MVPLHYEAYDWPAKPGDPPPLLESYTYTQSEAESRPDRRRFRSEQSGVQLCEEVKWQCRRSECPSPSCAGYCVGSAFLLLAYLLIVLAMMFLENSLLYFPAKYPDGDWNPPGLVFEDAWFNAADGTELHGWFVPCENPRAVALFLHGNAGNMTHRDDMLRELHRLGVAVLAFDYRGYGRSEGSPTEAGILADGRAARKWLAERAGIPESEIVLMGESLGGAVAVQLAAEAPARGLVLENVFCSLPDVAAFHYPWLPVQR